MDIPQQQPGGSQPGHTQALTSDWFTSSSDHFCHRGHLSLSSNVVSLEVQQHCSWLYQKADRQMPSFRSVIQSTARSMTPARVPGRSSKSHWDGSQLGPGSMEGRQKCPCPRLTHAPEASFISLEVTWACGRAHGVEKVAPSPLRHKGQWYTVLEGLRSHKEGETCRAEFTATPWGFQNAALLSFRTRVPTPNKRWNPLSDFWGRMLESQIYLSRKDNSVKMERNQLWQPHHFNQILYLNGTQLEKCHLLESSEFLHFGWRTEERFK